MTTIDSATMTPNNKSANACKDVPRAAATAASWASLPANTCAPVTRLTSASKAARSRKPPLRWNASPAMLPTEEAKRW